MVRQVAESEDRLGLGAKLNFAFITVILVMVLGTAAYTLVIDYMSTKNEAQARVDKFIARLIDEFNKCAEMNSAGAEALAGDARLTAALASNNQAQAAAAIKDFVDNTGFDGFIAVIDPKGRIFYSTETPAKSGDQVRSDGQSIDFVLMRREPFKGSAAFSPTGAITISSMVPVAFGSSGRGVVSLNEPLTGEFLAGLATKLALEPDHITGVDMALISAHENRVVATTPGLIGTDGGYLARVNQSGLKSVPQGQFEEGGRLWKPFKLEEGKGNVIGEILVSTPVPSIIPKVTIVGGQIGIVGGIAFVLSLLFTAGISGSVSRPLHFLLQRGRDLASGKQSLPPLEGLSGEWLELGELMDTSVSSMRSSVQSLKQQLSKHSFDVDERLRQAESASGQLETVNRQLTDKTRQLAEMSKQINLANQQTAFVQQKLDSALQIATEGFLILDQFGNILTANPVVLNWMGVNQGAVAGQHCFDLIKKPGEGRGMHGQAFSRHGGNPQDLIAQFYPEGVVYHKTQDKTVEVLMVLQPVVGEDGNIQGYVMVLHDKSQRAEIARLRNEIVAMLQDSIRAPLVSVEGIWKSLLRDASQTMSPAAGQSLAQLRSHYEQLLGLVDSLLMMYGGIIPPPVIPREQVIITRLVADCLEEVSEKARQCQLSLDYKTGTGLPPVLIDRESVYRVTIQLLEKMMEITQAGGRVRVETLVKGGEMRMGFYSSGPALPPSEIEDMFVGFIQGKHMEETYSSRLSMYLARENIERIGGKIWAESQEGRGTAIFFTLGIA